MRKLTRGLLRTALATFALVAHVSAQTQSGTPAMTRSVLMPDHNGVYELAVYKSGLIELDRPVKRISVANPGIADILVIRNRELYVVGKALGSTNITTWDGKGRVTGTYEVTVTHDVEALKLTMHRLLPGERIAVQSAQERIVLSGQASNLVKMQAAVDLAESFLPDCIAAESSSSYTDNTKEIPVRTQQKTGDGDSADDCKSGEVLNLMQVSGAQQVMLEVKVAEVSRQLLRKLDSRFNFFYRGGNGSFGGAARGSAFPNLLDEEGLFSNTLGGLGDAIAGAPTRYVQPGLDVISDNGIFLSYLGSDFLATAIIDASKERGLGKILAEPTLVTLTGEEAQFLSGGEYPIPVSADDGGVTVEFKEFGVELRFLPVVLDTGNINMRLNVGVSELANQNSVAVGVENTTSVFAIPSLTKRNVASTVELADGQTIGIAGLLKDDTRALVNRLPGVGDVPVLGALFTSQEYISGQTELVIFVTPHLAKPIAPDKVALPTDSYMAPSDLEFYLLGKLQASAQTVDGSASSVTASESATVIGPSGGLDAGKYGHGF
jgi:pilus assembly protein CpaC